MKTEHHITLFEHSTLRVNGTTFRQEHLSILDQWSLQNCPPFIKVGRNSITFSEYVGIVQIQDLVIEILPKVGRLENTPEAWSIWRSVLYDMLQVTGVISSRHTGKADLKTSNRSLLDVLLREFLSQVESLITRGLKKAYRHQTGNLTTLRGKIVFRRHALVNHTHRERNYCHYTAFTQDNLINQIIKRALVIVTLTARAPQTAAEAKRLLLFLERVSDKNITENDITRVSRLGVPEYYSEALQLSALIIRGVSPSFFTGRETVLSILFNMNELYESYIYRIFKQAERCISSLKVKRQRSKRFWETRHLRPDIVIERSGRKFIVDTKWKLPKNNTPSDPDLKQMFAYNRIFDCGESFLLYPATKLPCPRRSGKYAEGSGSCTMEYINLLDDENKLRRDFLPEIRNIIGYHDAL